MAARASRIDTSRERFVDRRFESAVTRRTFRSPHRTDVARRIEHDHGRDRPRPHANAGLRFDRQHGLTIAGRDRGAFGHRQLVFRSGADQRDGKDGTAPSDGVIDPLHNRRPSRKAER